MLGEAWELHLVPRTEDAPTVVSLFAGCGGSSLGYSMAGYRELLAVDFDGNACRMFGMNLGGVPVLQADVVDVTIDMLAEHGLVAGELDVLDGSPPCQGFSTAGKRNASDGRNGLGWKFIDLVEMLRPRAFVMENVPGMLTGKMWPMFEAVTRRMRETGYDVAVAKLDASAYGVPQRRMRLVWVGARLDLGRSASHPAGGETWFAAADALGGLPEPEDGDEVWLHGKLRSVWRGLWEGQTVADAMTSRQAYFNTRKFAGGRPAYTITASEGTIGLGGALHWAEPRRFTAREIARFMSFPDGYELTGKRCVDVAKLGDAVPPLMIRAVARHVREEVLRV